MKKSTLFTAMALALALAIAATPAQAQRFRLRLSKPIRIGNVTIQPQIRFGGHGGVHGGIHGRHGHGHNYHWYEVIDRLAVRMERQARGVLREVHAHFRSTPQYRHLDHDVHEMVELAEHIHDVAHRHGSRAHIRADVRKLDRLFHHVEDLVQRMAHYGRLDYQAYRHLKYSLRYMGRTLHDLLHELNH